MLSALPTKEEFEALRFVLWNVFEIILTLIAMAGVVVYSLKHIPSREDTRRGQARK